MSKLADKLRASRRFVREIEGFKLTLKRPTDEEFRAILSDEKVDYMHVCKTFVVDWSGVLENQLIGSAGNDREVSFDLEAWQEFIVDQPKMWEPLVKAIIQSYEQHVEKRGDDIKNS